MLLIAVDHVVVFNYEIHIVFTVCGLS